MTTATLPTRQNEDFRYSDLAALAAVWPVERETIAVAAGDSAALTLVPDGERVARHLVITLGDGARFDLREFNDAVLDTGSVPLAALTLRIEAWIKARR